MAEMTSTACLKQLLPRALSVRLCCLTALVLASLALRPSIFAQQTETLHWWEREPLRIVDVVTSFDQLMQRAPADWATGKAVQLYNAEHFEVMNLIKGLDDQGFFFSSKAAG